ncbi:MAG: NlpC/P60 family protein [Elusimicrobia bacterium]|nr:NlpC/P60 family protein [Elusimicrobiota bacterium]
MLNKLLRNIVLFILPFLFLASFLEASYTLVVLGDFTKEQSESLCRQLSSRGYPVYLLYGENPEVRIGPYDTREKAQDVLTSIEQEEQINTKIIEEENFDQLIPEDETQDKELAGKIVNEETKNLYSDERAKKIVSLGLDLFGHPYKYGGESIGQGIDCSFFVQTIFKDLGIDLPRTAYYQYAKGVKVEKENLKVGDLVFFKKVYYSKKKDKKGNRITYSRINHVGIYIGNGELIHATVNVKHVTISRLDEPYFVRHYAGARRVLSD